MPKQLSRDLRVKLPRKSAERDAFATKTQEIEAKRAAVREAIESADAGRLIPHEKVRRWVMSWGTEKELAKPRVPSRRKQ